MKKDFVISEFLAQVRNGQISDSEATDTLRTLTVKERVAYYRAMQRHEKVLPSGMPVVLRDVDMTDIMMAGDLPPSMLEAAVDAAEDDEVDLQALGVSMMQKNAAEFTMFLNAIVMAALVDPPMSQEGDDTHLSVGDIVSEDKGFIMEWVNREATSLKSFRPEEKQPVGAS